MNADQIKILFSKKNHQKFLTFKEADENKANLIRHLESTYNLATLDNLSNYDELRDYQILVIGAPTQDLEAIEKATIKKFVETGGGLLLVSNSETILNPLSQFEQLVDSLLGLEILEFLNAPPGRLESFSPHYLTANVRKIKVGNIAYLIPSSHPKSPGTFHPIAEDQEMQRTIIACAEVKQGRVVVAADIDMFDSFLCEEDNQTLVTNLFTWLSQGNSIDIKEFKLPKTINWAQSDIATLTLYNPSLDDRLKVKCTLESDKDAVNESPCKERSILPKQVTLMQWTIHPRILGEQSLRLSIEIAGEDTLYFDKLPEIRYLSPEPLKLEIKNSQGGLQTTFETGEEFLVYGSFYGATGSKFLLSQLRLKVGDGLKRLAQKVGKRTVEWKVKAVAKGAQGLRVEVKNTGQFLPAAVKIEDSEANRRIEIETAYVRPLDAEIAARLTQVHPLFEEVGNTVNFKVLSIDDFLREVYPNKYFNWLKRLIEAGHNEDLPDPSYDLLGLLVDYVTPCFLANKGAFIPHAPKLAMNLAELYPTNKKRLEYNLLWSERGESFEIKQKIAAYLLHEKYGHGFFATQTRLGQQLALLDSHKPEVEPAIYELVNDSALIVDEGFAAWLELTFLEKLSPDIRQSVDLRYNFLIEENNRLAVNKKTSAFFEKFPPRYHSVYREGFTHLRFISSTFGPSCAIDALLLASDVDLGIREEQGDFICDAELIRERLLDEETWKWRSHERLRQIGNGLYQRQEEVEEVLRTQDCPMICHRDGCRLLSLLNLDNM
jgi:hypothetical protein